MSKEKKFPLQNALPKATPIRSVEGLTPYAAGAIPEIDVDKLEYFVLSVFGDQPLSIGYSSRNLKTLMLEAIHHRSPHEIGDFPSLWTLR
jgi:hypothetical protein